MANTKDTLHVLIQVDTVGRDEWWAIPINGLGMAKVDMKDEKSIARELRLIADRFDAGMGYEAATNLRDLI